MYPFDGAVGLWMIRRHPDFGNSQKITQLRYHLPRELGHLVRHQPSREPKHRKELVVQDAHCSVHGMIVGDVRLGVACKVILDDQDILHNGFLFYAHCDFHGHVVDVYQVQRLCTEDGLHRRYLWFGFKNTALWTVADTHHHSLGHTWPPESLSKQAQCAVPALVFQVSVTSINRRLSFQPQHHECQDIFITSLGRHPQVEEITPEHEILLVCGIDAAFRVWHVVF